MAMRRRSRRSSGGGFRSGARRKTQWVDTDFNAAVVVGAASTITSLLSDLIGNDTQGMTLVRMLIRMWVSDQDQENSADHTMLDIGVGMADQESFTAGVLPDPGTSADQPHLGWVWKDAILQGQLKSAAGGHPPIRIYEDIRSRRRIDDGELYITWTNTALFGNGFDLRISGLVRCLFQLP